MRLFQLRNIIPDDAQIGFTVKGYDGIPLVYQWKNFKSG